jgi:hypothetical protein
LTRSIDFVRLSSALYFICSVLSTAAQHIAAVRSSRLRRAPGVWRGGGAVGRGPRAGARAGRREQLRLGPIRCRRRPRGSASAIAERRRCRIWRPLSTLVGRSRPSTTGAAAECQRTLDGFSRLRLKGKNIEEQHGTFFLSFSYCRWCLRW